MPSSPGYKLQNDPLCSRRLHYQESCSDFRDKGLDVDVNVVVDQERDTMILALLTLLTKILMLLTRKGELITELCFVVAGSLEVVQDGEILAFLGRFSMLLFDRTTMQWFLESESVCISFIHQEVLQINLPSTGMMFVEIQTGKNQNKVQKTFQCIKCNYYLFQL